MVTIIGQPVRRKEDYRLLAGRGSFSEDIQFPGMLWASFVRSPHAHARIRGIDTSAALAHPQVVAALTGRDVHPRYPSLPSASLAAYNTEAAPFYLMAVEKARFVGEVVAMVVARDRYAARDAADLISVDYEVLPAAVDPEAALRPDAPRVHDDRPTNDALTWHKTTPKVAQAFEEADVIIRERFVQPRIHAVPMEPRAGIAHWDPTQRSITVWASLQSAHELRDHVAHILGLPKESVRGIAPDVGGGFGAKHAGEVEYLLLAIASYQIGLPVKWVATRSEDFLGLSHARGKVSYIEIAATKEGRVRAVRVRHIANLGAYPKGGTPMIHITSAMISVGAYHIPEADLEVHSVYTNATPEGAYRGYGRPEGIFLIERGMDLLAKELKLDPAEIRRRNFVPPDAFPYRTAGGDTYDSGNYEAGLNRALELCDYPALRKEQARLRAQGRYMGIGLSSWVKSGGFGPGSLDPGTSAYEWGRVRMDPLGKLTIYTGSSPHGQGNYTTFSQVAAQVLGVSVDDITVLHGDTATVAYGVGTFASRNMVVGGTAVYNAAHKVLAKMRLIAAHRLGIASEEVSFENGVFTPRGRNAPRLTFQEVAQAAHMLRARPADVEYGLDETAFFQPTGLTFNSGTYVAVVEVDPETGDVDLQRLFCVDDQGVVVNPMIVEGQVHGGAVQGIGQALYEQIVYDEAGQLLTGSLMDYAMPTAEMAPKFVTATLETPSPLNPLGVKGMGEGPTTGAPPAVVNAVVDALEPLGVRHIEMPLTPERVWHAIESARRGGRR